MMAAVLIAAAGSAPGAATSLHAQITFGQTFTVAEKCADNSELLGPIDGIRAGALGLRVRARIPGYRLSKRSNDEIAAQFLRQNPCVLKSIRSDQCPDVQKLIDDTTVDATVGAKLKIIFPDETADMRERYAEKFVRVFCPRIEAPKSAK
jgi:hypothetical protein